MPDSTKQPEPPAVQVEDNILENPVISNDGLKAMAQKFRELSTETPATPAPGAAPDAGQAKGAGDKTSVAPAEPKPESKAPLAGEKRKPSKEESFRELEQARNDFRDRAEKLSGEKSELEKQLTTIRSELDGLKKSIPTDPNELQKQLTEREALKKERDELIEKIEAISFEKSPRFQNWYNGERDKHLKVALRQFPANLRAKAEELLKNGEASTELDELMEPLGKTSKRLVDGALEALAKLEIERADALEKGREKYRELQAHEQEEQQKQQEQRRTRLNQAAEMALSKASTLEAFQPKEGDPEHNSAVDQRKAFVRGFVTGQLDQETALLVPAAAAQWLYAKQTTIPSLQKRVAELEGMVKELQQSSPDMRSGSGGKPQPKSDNSGKPGSFASDVMSKMGYT